MKIVFVTGENEDLEKAISSWRDHTPSTQTT